MRVTFTPPQKVPKTLEHDIVVTDPLQDTTSHTFIGWFPDLSHEMVQYALCKPLDPLSGQWIMK